MMRENLARTALVVCLLASATNVQAQQSGNWIATGSLSTGRDFHTATILANGKVLVVGGYAGANPCCGVAELYDPATGQWSADRQHDQAPRRAQRRALGQWQSPGGGRLQRKSLR